MRPLLLGHRGARATRHVPENTLASFELCLEHGCDGFEFDIRRSSDGVAVICHDPFIRGLRVESTPASQLALPALDQVLPQFFSRAFFDIELKVTGLAAPLVAGLREYPPSQGYVVSSFLPEVLTELHSFDPSIPLGFLYDRKSQLPPPSLPIAWMIPHVKLVDRMLIEEVQASGRNVMVWTVNRAAGVRQLADWGVDAIISDDTELLVHSLR
ncbi:MAG: glycerophosphodiester phosphodiesterase [Terriglobales bacterium]